MPNYVSMRTYKLKPDADPAEFERAFAEMRPVLGLQKVFLLKGYVGVDPTLASSEFDYASIHIYASPEEAANTVKLAVDAQTCSELSAPLQRLVQFWRVAHSGALADAMVNGFTLVAETP